MGQKDKGETTKITPKLLILKDKETFLFFGFFCFFFVWLVFFFFLVFQDRVSLCGPGCPGAHFVDQAGLELRSPPASAS